MTAPHLSDGGLCQCGCDECTLRLTGYCICFECLCGAPDRPDYTHKLGGELRTDVNDPDHYRPGGVGLPAGMDSKRPVPGEDGQPAAGASPGA